ncbi:MAG TPA: DNRLRE domain-containing protein, partial [Candidatus Thalassarchaeaceae archaeon]|nr:DNRLRE domain-containing protein [Candidatus Thalassarchaeaceae archaeon]
MLLTLLLLGTIPALPNLLIMPASAGQVNHFGNSGFPNSINLTFTSAGNDTSTNLTLGASAVASSASFDVQGWPNSQGDSPLTIGIDVGDDGDLEWAFGGPGNGSFGYVNEFSNGWDKAALNLSSGQNMSYSLRLPLNATVTSASMNVSTLSELTLSGSDVQDTYIRKPNPSYGNSTHANCNYGNATVNVVGKTEWVNWNIYRSLYWFNLSQLPAVTVLDANLSFWIDDVVNNANSGQPVTVQHSYDIHPLLKDWEEGQEYNAVVQQGPGVTWNKAIDNVTGTDYSWTTAGASSASDRGAAVASITESPANLEQTWMDFNSQSLTNLVQSWVNGSVSNQGLLFIGDESTSKPDGSRLTITTSDNSTHGPRLVVVFEGSSDVTAAIDIGNDGNMQWNHSGNLSNGSVIPNFAASINSLLANSAPTFTDAWGNEFVDIPVNVTGNATLILDDIDVRYDWTPTVTTSPNGDL